jgi:lipopolysaccharide assembly outer membrane protein LptD (OstA)
LLNRLKPFAFFLIIALSLFLPLQAQIAPDSLLQEKMLGDALTHQDSIVKDTLKVNKPKEALADIVTHTADDYIAIDLEKNITTLYNNAKLHYQDVDLEAGVIIIDYKNELIKAFGIKDSLGYQQLPYFKQGEEESTQDSLLVNYKTERALIWGVKSMQGEMYVGSGVTKKVNDSTLYVRDISITTSKKDRPDYYIGINKAKIIPNKKIIAGMSQLYIADVPTPAILPFAYFPLTKTRTSGILMPTWNQSSLKGYSLQNGGYYMAISDYFDLALTGDIYTNGSWGIRARSNYALKYKFRGSFSFNYDNNINSMKGFDDYSKSTQYNIQWTHSQDAAANPNANLSASVNMGSSKYFKESLNEYSTNSFLNNTLNSSISYSKKFVGTPFNLSLSATHSQNTNTQDINMTLPSMVLNMDRIYPFAPKNGSKKNAIQRISLNYNLNGRYDIRTNDDDFLSKRMFEGARTGMKHTVSLSTNMKMLSYFTLNPSANYNEYWYLDYISKSFDANTNKVIKDTLNGFKSIRDYSMGVGLSTNIYGTFNFKKGRLKAIRHTISPSVSYSYRPDFGFYNKTFYDPLKNEYVSYSPFEGAMFGSPGAGVSNSIGINIRNTFEAKVMEKDSTKTEPKRISLLNNLNISGSYDITRDSLRWSTFGLTTGVDLFDKKMRINMNATLDPYAINAAGNRIDTFNIANGGSLFRMTNAGITLNYSLSDETFSGEKSKDEDRSQQDTSVDESEMMGGDLKSRNNQGNGQEENVKKAKLYYLNIPWNMNLSYSLQFSNQGADQGKITSSSLMFNGDVELTPKWSVGYSSGYDFKNKGITYTQLNFQRDLDSWQMSFNWVPFGGRSTYYFYIGVKSSVLSDLKYEKQSLPDRRLF